MICDNYYYTGQSERDWVITKKKTERVFLKSKYYCIIQCLKIMNLTRTSNSTY